MADSPMPAPTPAGADLLECLRGVIVIDLTQYLSGPFATYVLASLGATVIKVERPVSGDENRHQPPFVSATGVSAARQSDDDLSLAFMKRNAGKLSVTLDIKIPSHYEALRRLVAKADAFVHNIRRESASRLRVDAETIRKINPGIVYCSIDGLGPFAEQNDRRGVTDLVGQALSGIMATTGEHGGPPVRCSAPIADQSAGLFAAIAVLGGLVRTLRNPGRSAAGPSFSVSLLGALNALSWDEHHDIYVRQGVGGRHGSTTPRIAPFGIYRSLDEQYIAISATGVNEWQLLCDATMITEFIENAEWRSLANRVRDKKRIDELLGTWVRERPLGEAMTTLTRAGATAAPVYSHADMLADPRYRTTLLYQVEHPVFGPADAWSGRFPISPDGINLKPPARPAPRLGADTQAVLADLCGYSPDEVRMITESEPMRS